MVLALPELTPTRRDRLQGGWWCMENMAARGFPLREVRGELLGELMLLLKVEGLGQGKVFHAQGPASAKSM